MDANEQPVSRVFRIGVAFPLKAKAISGEIKSAVGVEKFWTSIDDRILTEWRNYPARTSYYYT